MAMSHLLVVVVLLLAPAALAAGNVAVQWNLLVSQFVCTHNIQPTESNFLYLQVALAQWHALLALKDTGAGTTVEPAVVAYASRAVLAAYLTLEEDNNIDPLLDAQLRSMDHLTIPQKKLAQRLAESVALDVVERRAKDPRRTFTYGAARAAVDERQLDPTPGLFRFLKYTANKTLIIPRAALGQTFVLPNALAYIEGELQQYKPPKVPSAEWDVEYEQLVKVGRDNWEGRTRKMNHTAGFIFGSQQKGSLCRSPVDFWFAIARATLPNGTSLYDTALLFSKLGVAIHDSRVVLAALQYGFWFWRPVTAFRAGDAHHAPIPDWNQWVLWNTHPEYPSGATTISGSAGAVMEAFFGKSDVEFTIQGTYPGPACSTNSDTIGPRHYKSFAAAVEDTKLGRMYAGAHYNISTRHGADIGAKVADYIWKNWDRSTPSGVLPYFEYLNVVSKQPPKAGDWSPVTLQF